jgi:hypothetical protein
MHICFAYLGRHVVDYRYPTAWSKYSFAVTVVISTLAVEGENLLGQNKPLPLGLEVGNVTACSVQVFCIKSRGRRKGTADGPVGVMRTPIRSALSTIMQVCRVQSTRNRLA